MEIRSKEEEKKRLKLDTEAAPACFQREIKVLKRGNVFSIIIRDVSAFSCLLLVLELFFVS